MEIGLAAGADRRLWVVVAGVFVLGLVPGLMSLAGDGGAATLTGAGMLASAALYVVALLVILRDIVTREQVDREVMFGALAAYLLLGMAFGFGFGCLGAVGPGPFFGDGGEGTLPRTLFFSFVTLTTTGYGNLVPAGTAGQGLAVLEALLGQFFLVTAVAKVVDAWRPRRWPR